MNKKIAPLCQQILKHSPKCSVAPEIRALLAVARAARLTVNAPWGSMKHRAAEDGLLRALARLERAGNGGRR